jgi:phospholipase D1/2
VTPGTKKLSTGDKARLIAPIVIYAVLAVIAWKLGYFRSQKVTAEAESASGNPWIGVVFAAIYATIASLALPVGPLAYAAGAIFGFLRGSIIVWLGSMVGAVAGYHLARTVWAAPARRLLGRHRHKLRDLRKSNVFMTSLRMQLMPIIPFGVFNYAAAISKLRVSRFLAGTALGIIPGTLMATFVGDRLIAGVHGEGKKAYLLAAAVAVVLLGVSFAPKLWKKIQ